MTKERRAEDVGALNQVEWLKRRIADLQLPKRFHNRREAWLIACGMPEEDGAIDMDAHHELLGKLVEALALAKDHSELEDEVLDIVDAALYLARERGVK